MTQRGLIPLPGAVVILEGRSLSVNANGEFQAEVSQGQHALRVSAPGHAPYARTIQAQPHPVYVSVPLLPSSEQVIASFSQTNRFRYRGASIVVPANSIVDDRGRSPAQGTIRLAVLRPARGELRSMPGEFAGIDASGRTVPFESAGAVHITVQQGEKRLQIRRGATMQVLIPLPKRYRTRKTVPLWHFDPQSARWKQEATARIVRIRGAWFADARLPHLSWWNYDFPYDQRTSIWVKSVVDSNGAEVRSSMTAEGIDYSGISESWMESGWNGPGICVDVKPSARVALILAAEGVLEHRREVRTPIGPSSCRFNPGAGVVIQKIALTRRPVGCLRGRTTLPPNFAKAVVRLFERRSEKQKVAEADGRGEFCLDDVSLPGSVLLEVEAPLEIAGVREVVRLQSGFRSVPTGNIEPATCALRQACIDVGVLELQPPDMENERRLLEIEKLASARNLRSDRAIRAAYRRFERIVLRDGTSVRGAVIASTKFQLLLHTSAGVMRIQRSSVASQEFLR